TAESPITSSQSSSFLISIEFVVDEACAAVPVPAKNENIYELNETIKTMMTESNKLKAELIEIEKRRVAANEQL
ncbi:unnamed protein product, partial [Ceratitis capitata]